MTKCSECGFTFVPDKKLDKAVDAACPCGATVTLQPEPEPKTKPAKARQEGAEQ